MSSGGLSLGRRIALLVALGLSLVISLFGFLSLRGLQESSNRAVQERLVAAQLTSRHIDDFLTLYLDVLSQNVDEETAGLRSTDAAARARVMDRLRHQRSGAFAHAILLTDREGNVLWADNPGASMDASVSSEAGIAAEVLRRGGGTISNAYHDGLGRVQVSLGVPVRGDDGTPAGALIEVLDLTDPLLSGFVQPVSLGSTGYAEIVDSNGLVLASSDPSRLFLKSDHTDQFAAMISSGRPTVGGCHSCHEAGSNQVQPDILAFAPLTVAPWGVAIRQSEGEALGPINEMRRLLLIAGAVSLLVAVWIAWLASRAVVWPIRSLTTASRRIASGDLDWSIDRRGPAEVGALAGAFDEMRARLKASLESLEKANSTLESRVEQRTKQLAALLEVSKLLTSTLDLRRLLDAVVARAGDVLELADAGVVALFDERGDRLNVRGSWGYGESIMMLSLARGEGTAGLAAVQSRPLLLDTAEAIEERRESLSVENRAWVVQATRRLGAPASMMSVPLVVKGATIGTLTVEHYRDSRVFSTADLSIASALADQIAVAVENARLYEEIRETEALTSELLDKVISAQEDERRRIARELHDDTCQSLAVLAIRLADLAAGLPKAARQAQEEMERLKDQVSATLREVRTIAYNLRPNVLDDLGLTMALDWLCKEQVARRGLEVSLDIAEEQLDLPPAVETILFRITQEALNNVVKHSGASHARVSLARAESGVALEVEDDGLGFDVQRILRARGSQATLGLHGMIERARLSGGTLRIVSYPGHGTRITAELPVQREREASHEENHSLTGGRSSPAQGGNQEPAGKVR
ncbi:MAG TPA: GAF domain-containing protein [Chloroflexota bacterium]